MKKLLSIFIMLTVAGLALGINAHEGWDELPEVQTVTFNGSLEDWERIEDLGEEILILSADGEVLMVVRPPSGSSTDQGELSERAGRTGGAGGPGSGTGGNHLTEKNAPRPQFPGSGTAPNDNDFAQGNYLTEKNAPRPQFPGSGTTPDGGHWVKKDDSRPEYPGSGTGGTSYL